MAFTHVSNVFKGVPVVFETDSLGFVRESRGNLFENPRNTPEHIWKHLQALGKPLTRQTSKGIFGTRAGWHYGLTPRMTYVAQVAEHTDHIKTKGSPQWHLRSPNDKITLGCLSFQWSSKGFQAHFQRCSKVFRWVFKKIPGVSRESLRNPFENPRDTLEHIRSF